MKPLWKVKGFEQYTSRNVRVVHVNVNVFVFVYVYVNLHENVTLLPVYVM